MYFCIDKNTNTITVSHTNYFGVEIYIGVRNPGKAINDFLISPPFCSFIKTPYQWMWLLIFDMYVVAMETICIRDTIKTIQGMSFFTIRNQLDKNVR